ncbi:histidine phosphatase family protein [Candidatus Steffania adelgidicola]|uniref:histidine phosphatase family protein n=1 Tax=Candidatus Steffania adelgidicola TaxID=1076626 RepID=UPI003B969171
MQGKSYSELAPKGKRQAEQVAKCVLLLGISNIISSELGWTRRTEEMFSDILKYPIMVDIRMK